MFEFTSGWVKSMASAGSSTPVRSWYAPPEVSSGSRTGPVLVLPSERSISESFCEISGAKGVCVYEWVYGWAPYGDGNPATVASFHLDVSCRVIVAKRHSRMSMGNG